MTSSRSSRILAALLLLVGGSAFPARAQADSRKANARWGADYFPNILLTTHEGKEVRFFDDLVEGKVVVINFIYTSCPDACPLETSRLLEVQQILGDRVGQDVFLYSISIDPARDTVEVLKEYAERYRVGPGWTFLRGSEADVALLRKKLGVYRDETTEDLTNHNLSLVIGNQATGRWTRSSPFENPYVLATQIGEWLHNWKLPPQDGNDYASAPKLRNISTGESLFRTRCSTCHGIGATDGVTRVGPDLVGVTQRREREWLDRWLAAPDRMLVEGDPIAVGLYEAFNRVPMPNLRLNEVEIDALIEYVDSESRRVVEERGSGSAAGKPEGPAPCCRKNESPVLSAEASEGSGGTEEARGENARFPMASIWLVLAAGGIGLFARFGRPRRG